MTMFKSPFRNLLFGFDAIKDVSKSPYFPNNVVVEAVCTYSAKGRQSRRRRTLTPQPAWVKAAGLEAEFRGRQ